MAKRKNPRASAPVATRVSDRDFETLAILADQHRATVSEVVRTLLENELERHPIDDVTRAAFKRRRMEEMGIEPTRRAGRRGLGLVRSHLAAEPVRSDRSADRVTSVAKPGPAGRSEALKRAA